MVKLLQCFAHGFLCFLFLVRVTFNSYCTPIKNSPFVFTTFLSSIEHVPLPDQLNDPFEHRPHPLCVIAAQELQEYLKNQTEWHHNFGLEDGLHGTIVGKMFGVLVVKNQMNDVGYLSAYSGKLAGGYHQSRFVPPVFDGLNKGSFLNVGMTELTRINEQIELLQEMNEESNEEAISLLKEARKSLSNQLHAKLYDSFIFLNRSGEKRSLREIFTPPHYKNPPAGAGECSAPKLLQYAYLHHLKPIAMAEFWWGQSPKTDTWKHGEYYPACKEKCKPILGFMLST